MKSEDADQITSYEVTDDDADIHTDYLQPMRFEEGGRNGKVVEGVSHAVCEAAYDEERNSEKEREIVLLARECHCRCHYESASYSQKAATESTVLQSDFKYLLCCSLKIEIRGTCQKADKKTSDNVSQKDYQQVRKITFVYESRCAGVKFQLVAHDCKESESKEHCSGKASDGKVTESCYSNGHACQYR